jgi:hypothetical protein
MNHNTAPRSKAEIHHSAAHPNTVATVKTTKDNYWQEDDSRSSRNNNSRSNGNSNRNGNSRGGFGKSMRK